MSNYRVNLMGSKIIDCVEVTKISNSYDYCLIAQYRRFVHFDENLKPTAYLCKANSQIEAMAIATGYLEKLNMEIAK